MTAHNAERRTGNWGRWGGDDERGAANLLSEEHVLACSQLVKRGRVYPLGLDISARGKPAAHPMRARPLHMMARDAGDYAAGERLPGDLRFADDYLLIACHGSTHVDALAHLWAGEHLYNGHPASSVRSNGAARCGIEKLGGIVTRGVLLDLAADRQLEHLAGGEEISAAQLSGCAERQGTPLRAGDCVLIRTGWQQMLKRDADAYYSAAPGIGTEAAALLAAADVCAVGADTMGIEVDPPSGDEGASPVHRLLIREHGIYMIELLDLERLASERAHEFLFVLSPLRIVGGTGSPVNPIAVA